jgi:hypothetical protein
MALCSCSARNGPTNEKETKQCDSNEVLSKLLEEIASLREIISLLQSERIQYTHSRYNTMIIIRAKQQEESKKEAKKKLSILQPQ